MKIILVHPEIPQNTGNIVRTCAVSGCDLILVKPLGFSVASRHLKRAGLDYWEGVNVSFIDSLPEYLAQTDAPFFFFSSHAKTSYHKASFPENSLLIFGSETKGLDPLYKNNWGEHFYTLPMREKSRCLNLSNTVSIVIYEALRQQGFPFYASI